jgi:hypothetical protein
MMFLLVSDVFPNGVLGNGAHREGRVTFLPGKRSHADFFMQTEEAFFNSRTKQWVAFKPISKWT